MADKINRLRIEIYQAAREKLIIHIAFSEIPTQKRIKMLKLSQLKENKISAGDAMISPKRSPETKSKFRPVDFVFAFFHPVSRESLRESFKKSDEMSRDIQDLLRRSKELHQEIDKALGPQSQSFSAK